MRSAKIFLNIAVLTAFALPTIAAAQTSVCQDGKTVIDGEVQDDKNGVYCSLTTIPGLTDVKEPVNPVKIITNAYGVSIGIAAILAIGFIIWAGIEYATVESISGHSDAKKRWEGALWGLALLLGSYLILRTINLDLVNINLDLGKPAVGELVDQNALQNALDSYSDSVAKLQGTNTAISSLTAQKTSKEAEYNALIDDGKINDPKVTQLQNELKSIDEQISKLEKDKTAQQSAVDKSRTQVQSATAASSKAFCYTSYYARTGSYGVASGGQASQQICRPTAKECEDVRSTDNPSSSPCQELSPLEAQAKYQYCFSYSEVKATKQYQFSYISNQTTETVNSTTETNKQCSITPANCLSLQQGLIRKNSGKKSTDNGFISSIGSCIPELKSS
ncbi:MAG TPA: hypothetical protein VIR98_02290 [Candidatus Paceibacterota bacterium]